MGLSLGAGDVLIYTVACLVTFEKFGDELITKKIGDELAHHQKKKNVPTVYLAGAIPG